MRIKYHQGFRLYW